MATVGVGQDAVHLVCRGQRRLRPFSAEAIPVNDRRQSHRLSNYGGQVGKAEDLEIDLIRRGAERARESLLMNKF